MALRSLRVLVVAVLFAACAGCGSDSGLVNPSQPKDLGPPWVNKTESQWGSSGVIPDASGNRVFSCTTNDFQGLIEAIATEFGAPIAVKPKEMLEWNLTVEAKGMNQDQVLGGLATKCRLSLGKSSSGLPMLTFPGKESAEEFVVKPEDEDSDTSDASSEEAP